MIHCAKNNGVCVYCPSKEISSIKSPTIFSEANPSQPRALLALPRSSSEADEEHESAAHARAQELLVAPALAHFDCVKVPELM